MKIYSFTCREVVVEITFEKAPHGEKGVFQAENYSEDMTRE